MISKDELRKKFSREPDRYYRVKLFEELGFERKQCRCGKFFWTLSESETCSDSTCQKYEFIGNPPTKKKMDYIETWRAVEKFFEKNGHRSIRSYPVVCRWFPGLYFTVASIVAFQRKSGGETIFELPYNPLIIPQVCLRFSDIPNVGVSGRHHTSFVMIGQHSLYDESIKEGYWKDRCIDLDFKLLTDVFQIPKNEVSFVEDVWVGPNAFGYSLEYFVRGLELGNAVFTEFLGVPERYKTMDKKIIDMGAGLERFAWMLNGTPTSYDAAFGPVAKKMKTLADYDEDIFRKYSKMAGAIDVEDSDAEAVKKKIAEAIGICYEKLNEHIEPVEAVFAVCDHSKTLLYAINDGQLPSNVGGGYNLRVILRRALSFIDEFKLDISLFDVCKMHANYLKKMDKRITENLDDVEKIIEVEEARFKKSKANAVKTVEIVLEKNERLDNIRMGELYESQGITPELIKDVAKSKGLSVDIPPDFYARTSEKHLGEKAEDRGMRIGVDGIPKTGILFHDKPRQKEFTARAVKIIDGKYVALDKTCFYPRSGGQENDTGNINGCKVLDVEKISDVVIHRLGSITFAEGDTVKCSVDWERREQLSKHHTATHIVNAACRKLLGNHVWQHSAYKDVGKARLDITHFEMLSEKQTRQIEKLSNEIVRKKYTIKKRLLPRMLAEEKYGFRIYQGGAVPEKELRIVEIGKLDVEACGGIHRRNTGEVGRIMILKAEHIQDGIVRIVFTAGEATKKETARQDAIIDECSRILGVPRAKVPVEARKLFSNWKKMRKQIENATASYAEKTANALEGKFINNVLIEKLDANMAQLQEISKKLSGNGRVVLLFGMSDKIYIFGSSDSEADIGRAVRNACGMLGGKGGGTPKLGQGIGTDFGKLDAVLNEMKKELI